MMKSITWESLAMGHCNSWWPSPDKHLHVPTRSLTGNELWGQELIFVWECQGWQNTLQHDDEDEDDEDNDDVDDQYRNIVVTNSYPHH